MNDDFNETGYGESVYDNEPPSLDGYNNMLDHLYDRQQDIANIRDRKGKNEGPKNPEENPKEDPKGDLEKDPKGDENKKDPNGLDDSNGKKNKKNDELGESNNEKPSKNGKGSDELGESGDGLKKGKNSDELGNSKDENGENKKEKSDEKNEKDEKEKEEDDEKDDGKKKKKKGKIGRLLFKIKATLIIIGVALVAFVIAFIVVAIMTIIDNLTLGLSTSYGVPETTSEESGNVPGLYDDDKYRYDSEGNEMGRAELISYLENNSGCNGNIWTSISDTWNSIWQNKISDVCELVRYVKKETSNNGVDEALILSTIFYGYDTRPTAEEYINPDDVPDAVKTTEHFQSLVEVLQDKNVTITRDGISKIIDNAHATTNSYYYLWVIEEEKDDSGKVTSITGKCEYKEAISENYNLDKWKVFMRFGEEAASKFDDVVLKSKNYETSSAECKNEEGVYTKEALEQQVSKSAATYGDDVSYSLDYDSVTNARNAIKNPDETASEVFFQAADVDSKTKDTFKDYDGIEFDYKNGYAYQNFPSFKPSMESGGVYYGKVRIEYDDIFTPKVVEELIQNIISRKQNMNDALMRKDPDTMEDYSAGLNGYSGVPTGKNCMKYLSASLSDISVRLTDCYGTYLDTVSFEDYIIGVANGEVSNSNDDYVMAEMVAAISFALTRNNNYRKGSTINMRSGTCDQVYCSMLRGCTSKNTPVGRCDICNSFYIGGGKKNPDLYPKYQALYKTASDYLLVKKDAPFLAHYVSTVQLRWQEKAKNGMSFTQIMQEEYQDEGAELIRCSNEESEVATPAVEDDGTRVGNEVTAEYPLVSPDLNAFYGFSYKNGSDSTSITINPEWKNANLVTISPECKGNSDYANMKYTVHKSAAKSFQNAFKKVCNFLTDGVKIKNNQVCKYTIDDIQDGTVFIERKTSSGTFDTHAYGIAQDLNYSMKINVDGKDYTPYNTRELSEYLDFVNAIGGYEENCKNVNYVLWKYAYKEAGFYWGGNYGRNGNSGTYDGKLFELKYK